MYNALNLGECDVLLGAKQSFEVFEHKEEFNKDCDLVWEGRVVKHIGFSFATMIDPGTLCSSLVNEVFNFYLSESKWKASVLYLYCKLFVSLFILIIIIII